MVTINQSIKDSFSIISLILVFAFVLFDLRYRHIDEELKKELPPLGRITERDKFTERLYNVLLVWIAPLIVIYGILIYLFLPLSVDVILNSRFNLWHFDFLRTAFIFIVLLITFFLIWSIILAGKVILKIVKLRK